MRKPKAIALLIALVALLLGVSSNTVWDLYNSIDPPPPGYARVLEVYDGDTIEVQFGDSRETVRLIGVDTPETQHPNKPIQCFGKEATFYLQNRLERRDVRLETDPTNTNRDRYDRLLRYVYLDDELINQSLIRTGHGFAYTAFPFEKTDQFVLAQQAAERAGNGLWQACEVENNDGFFNSGPDLAAN